MTYTSPGWYPAPSNDSLLQYWDGELWTDRMRPGRDMSPSTPHNLPVHPEGRVLTSLAVLGALDKGEEILAGFAGSGGFRLRMFVATDRRVLWLHRKGVRGRLEPISIPYNDITEVEVSGKTRYAPQLIISTQAESYGVFAIPVQTLLAFAQFVEARVGNADDSPAAYPSPSTDQLSGTEPSASDTGDDLVARLERLVVLHESGTLNADEFAEAKALVLREANDSPDNS